MNYQQNERGCVFPSRDCRVNPEGMREGIAPELHRKARTAPEKMKSMLLGSVVVGSIFIPLYSDAVAFSIILDMNFISNNHIYLNPADDGRALKAGIHKYITYYISKIHHTTREAPNARYHCSMLKAA